MKPIFASVLLIILLTAGLLASCSGADDSGGLPAQAKTLTPTATLDPSGYQAVDSPACLVNEWNTLQAEQRRAGTIQWLQGDLLAWRPGQPAGQEELAYIAPTDRSSWFSGALTLAKGQALAEQILLAPVVLANGNLTWSPSGEWLAFLAYRPNDNLYTVMVVSADGARLVDLFPADLARTDTRTAQKAILGWKNSRVVQVIASCGETCRLAYDLDVSLPSQPVLTPTVAEDYTEMRRALLPDPLVITITPNNFPKNMLVTPSANLRYMGTVNWSSDMKKAAYLDRRGILWALSTEKKINYILDIGLRDVFETHWSPNADALAVRAEDRIFIFEDPCRHADQIIPLP